MPVGGLTVPLDGSKVVQVQEVFAVKIWVDKFVERDTGTDGEMDTSLLLPPPPSQNISAVASTE